MRCYAVVNVMNITVFHGNQHFFAGNLHDRSDSVADISHAARSPAALLTEQQHLGIQCIERAGQQIAAGERVIGNDCRDVFAHLLDGNIVFVDHAVEIQVKFCHILAQRRIVGVIQTNNALADQGFHHKAAAQRRAAAVAGDINNYVFDVAVLVLEPPERIGEQLDRVVGGCRRLKARLIKVVEAVKQEFIKGDKHRITAALIGRRIFAERGSAFFRHRLVRVDAVFKNRAQNLIQRTLRIVIERRCAVGAAVQVLKQQRTQHVIGVLDPLHIAGQKFSAQSSAADSPYRASKMLQSS